MKTIELSNGAVTTVDDEDYEYLNQWSWHRRSYCDGTLKYAARAVVISSKHSLILIHRVILGGQTKLMVDHKDGDGLNNCRNNLRYCTPTQNQANARLRRDNTSGYKGVCWSHNQGAWLARIMVDQKRLRLGVFKNKIDAAQAYDLAARFHFGVFARTNF